jgi:hypothetical protein
VGVFYNYILSQDRLTIESLVPDLSSLVHIVIMQTNLSPPLLITGGACACV